MLLPIVLPFAEITFLKAPGSVRDDTSAMSQPMVFLALLVVAVVVVSWLTRLASRGSSHRRRGPKPSRRRDSTRSPSPRALPNPILVDGSNVMHWKDETPQILAVQSVVEMLKRRGFTPGVVFDANAGYKLTGRYMNERDFALLLTLPADQVFVVPKGTPADPYLLSAARDFGARVVTRDRFRDWAEAHPEVKEPGFLVRGGYRDSGEFWLDEALQPTAAGVLSQATPLGRA